MSFFVRRAFAVIAGVLALPVMLFWKDRARFYSYLHRVWSKTSDKPVWMAQARKSHLRTFINRDQPEKPSAATLVGFLCARV
ncbi:putative periplasmic protein, partial [Salmonella enterica subsp. enterica serovar Newport str. WA_14885]